MSNLLDIMAPDKGAFLDLSTSIDVPIFSMFILSPRVKSAAFFA